MRDDFTASAGRAWRRLLVFRGWRRHDADMAEEIALHEEMKRDAFIAQGMTQADAAAAARRAMGNVAVMREDSREVWRAGWLRDFVQDVVYAARTLRRNPTFALVAILGLAFGLGFSAAVFTGYNAFALRGWQLPHADRMIALWATTPGRGDDGANPSGFSLAQLRAFTSESRTLDGAAAHIKTRADGTGEITAAPVSAGYFQLIGVPMLRGREFVPSEDRIEAPERVIVVSHRYWLHALGGNPAVVGSSIKVSGVPFTVIGVAAEGFDGTNIISVDAWIPMAALPVVRPHDTRSTGPLTDANECCLNVVARLAPDMSREAAEAELSAILARHARPGIDTVPRSVITLPFTFVGTGGPKMVNDVSGLFLLIGGGVAVVMLLACANVANLLLARATARQREMGIRLALGASRGRIVRQLMTESLLLALLAGIPALGIASVVPGWLVRSLTEQTHTLQFAVDWNVLLFTLGVAVVCCLLFGLAPALHASKPLSMGRTKLPLRSVFLSAQVVFCVVLLVASGLFVRSANIGRNLDLGFATNDVTELRIAFTATDDEAARSARLAQELPALATGIGVRRVAYSANQPFGPDGVLYRVESSAASRAAARAEERVARIMRVSPDYFSLLEIPLVAGRVFSGVVDRNEIVVNAPMAELLGGTIKAVGAVITTGDDRLTVVGVIPATHDVGARDVQPAIYRAFPYTSAPRVIVRGTPRDAARLAAAIRANDPSLTVSTHTYAWYVHDATASATFAALVSGAMGTLALVLASIGMFGVLSYWVQQRQQDISVRMALGAAPRNVVRLVLGATARAVGWGLAIGLMLAIGAAQLLRGSLYGLSPMDPASYAGALGVLVAAAVVATVLPMRRAVRIEPMQALRGD